MVLCVEPRPGTTNPIGYLLASSPDTDDVFEAVTKFFRHHGHPVRHEPCQNQELYVQENNITTAIRDINTIDIEPHILAFGLSLLADQAAAAQEHNTSFEIAAPADPQASSTFEIDDSWMADYLTRDEEQQRAWSNLRQENALPSSTYSSSSSSPQSRVRGGDPPSEEPSVRAPHRLATVGARHRSSTASVHSSRSHPPRLRPGRDPDGSSAPSSSRSSSSRLRHPSSIHPDRGSDAASTVSYITSATHSGGSALLTQPPSEVPIAPALPTVPPINVVTPMQSAPAPVAAVNNGGNRGLMSLCRRCLPYLTTR